MRYILRRPSLINSSSVSPRIFASISLKADHTRVAQSRDFNDNYS